MGTSASAMNKPRKNSTGWPTQEAPSSTPQAPYFRPVRPAPFGPAFEASFGAAPLGYSSRPSSSTSQPPHPTFRQAIDEMATYTDNPDSPFLGTNEEESLFPAGLNGLSQPTTVPPKGEPLDDGYRWRKYGNKAGKVVSRCYFRCSHGQCKAKKIVETAVDGVESPTVIYKESHNHERPSVTQRAAHTQQQLKDVVSMATTMIEIPADAGVPTPKAIIQIDGGLDPADDGFSWRKYGQKVVKGNLNPRSYFRCAHETCPVKKQVEQTADTYLTTYEGVHDHGETAELAANEVSDIHVGEKRQRSETGEWQARKMFSQDPSSNVFVTTNAFGNTSTDFVNAG